MVSRVDQAAAIANQRPHHRRLRVIVHRFGKSAITRPAANFAELPDLLHQAAG
jgi:hypothetical protein